MLAFSEGQQVWPLTEGIASTETSPEHAHHCICNCPNTELAANNKSRSKACERRNTSSKIGAQMESSKWKSPPWLMGRTGLFMKLYGLNWQRFLNFVGVNPVCDFNTFASRR
jgi:hypothetical protein